MSLRHLSGKGVPLNGLSLDLGTFSAMSYFASQMNITLNEAIALALTEWLMDGSRETFPADPHFDAKSFHN